MEVLTQEQAVLFKVCEGVGWHFLQENSKGSLPLLWLLSEPKPQETPQVNVNEYFRVFSVSFMIIESWKACFLKTSACGGRFACAYCVSRHLWCVFT